MSVKIHPTAIVEKGAELDIDVEVGPFSIIGPQVRIGANTKIQSHVVINGKTTLGKDNRVFPFAALGAVPQDLKYKNEPTELWIGDDNTIRESVTLNLGTVQGGGKTVLGSRNLLMAYVHFGHDCIVGNDIVISNATQLAGHATVQDFAVIGGMVGVAQFLTVGAYCYIAGRTAVDRDVPPYVIAYGERPFEIRGANIVGLRRRGLKAESISVLNESIKLWKRPYLSKDQCLLEIESQYGEYPEVKQFVDFIRKSERGCMQESTLRAAIARRVGRYAENLAGDCAMNRIRE
jgi:UDP-N-acetylglucosamine acyltransferase